MAYVRLFRRVRIAPGITLNLAKRGPSLSFGVRGAHLTVGRSGVRKTVGIPGTGVFYTSQNGWHSGIHTGQPFREAAPTLTDGQRVVETVAVVFLAVFLVILALAVLAAIVSH